MKHISKKIWFTLSLAIVAMSALFALKKPVQREKASHVVVDRLVNQLVCKLDSRSGGSRNYPRGFMSFSQKVVAKRDLGTTGGRQGWQRGDGGRKPIGGDF
ncbi:MAG: hypothetical protein LLF94_09155 [Chlamydiales bacterium]|nr:hypothetical protein [Chlamydiales bacterium]